jgi:hypothetical protein
MKSSSTFTRYFVDRKLQAGQVTAELWTEHGELERITWLFQSEFKYQLITFGVSRDARTWLRTWPFTSSFWCCIRPSDRVLWWRFHPYIPEGGDELARMPPIGSFCVTSRHSWLPGSCTSYIGIWISESLCNSYMKTSNNAVDMNAYFLHLSKHLPYLQSRSVHKILKSPLISKNTKPTPWPCHHRHYILSLHLRADRTSQSRSKVVQEILASSA